METFCPIHNLFFCHALIKAYTLLPVSRTRYFSKMLCTCAEGRRVRCRKRDNCLARKIVVPDKILNHPRGITPPNGVSKKYDIGIRKAHGGLLHKRRMARRVVVLAHDAASFVTVIEIGIRIRFLRFECKNIRPDGSRDRLRRFLRAPRRRVIDDDRLARRLFLSRYCSCLLRICAVCRIAPTRCKQQRADNRQKGCCNFSLAHIFSSSFS